MGSLSCTVMGDQFCICRTTLICPACAEGTHVVAHVHLQICQDTGAEPRSRETAVKLVHALLTGRHWPTHHSCLAGRVSLWKASLTIERLVPLKQSWDFILRQCFFCCWVLLKRSKTSASQSPHAESHTLSVLGWDLHAHMQC